MRRPLLAALLATAAATAPAGAHGCHGIEDPAGDAGVYTGTDVPAPGPSLDILRATVAVGARSTTFRIHVADLSLRAADSPTGTGWAFGLVTARRTVHVLARTLPDHTDASVWRGDTTQVWRGGGPRLDDAASTITWTVPNAVLAQAGITKGTSVRAMVMTRRVAGTAAVPGRDPVNQGVGDSDQATNGVSERWGRVGCAH
jgi:hypothetical protein